MASKVGTPWGRVGTGFAVGALAGLLAKDLDLLSLVSYWDDRTPFTLGAAFGGAVLWNTRLKWMVGLCAAGLLVLWTVVAYTPLSPWLAKDLIRRDALQTADAVFVLGSRLQMDGDLDDEAVSRLLHGLELVQQGHAPRLVLSELRPPFPSHSEAARRFMDGLSIEQEILSVGEASNTRTEAVAVAALYRERGWNRLLVVTAPLHSRRACASLEHEGVTVVCSPSVERSFDLETLDEPDGRLRAFSSIMHEKLGIWVYARRGWLGE
ncbi:MAG: YdcF family protein [Vicinamibacteria bacterium]